MRAIKRLYYAAAVFFLTAAVLAAAMLDQPPLQVCMEPVDASPGFWSEERQLVNINTATLDELCTLPQIGEKRAQAILDYRNEHGEFRAPEDLCNVNGISDGILSAVRDWITT